MRTALWLSSVLAAGVVAAQETPQMAYNNHCRTCHSRHAGDNRLGPTLHGVIGRKAGTLDGYPFTRSMAASDVTWDAGTLDAFIRDPDAVVPGHGMRPFQGIANADIRAAIIEALKDG
jgi:cytochrome c